MKYVLILSYQNTILYVVAIFRDVSWKSALITDFHLMLQVEITMSWYAYKYSALYNSYNRDILTHMM